MRLIPAADVKPFVRRNKNDARDAAAICTALSRPDMRFVAIKSVAQQRGLERSRDLLVKQPTQLISWMRSRLAELGIVAAQGRRGFAEALLTSGDERIFEVLVAALRMLLARAEALDKMIAAREKKILAIAKGDPALRRLATIPGVGGLTARAIGAGKQFYSARDFAAWCGLTPREHSSGAKRREKGIGRQGDIRMRKHFAPGTRTVMRNERSRSNRANEWQRGFWPGGR